MAKSSMPIPAWQGPPVYVVVGLLLLFGAMSLFLSHIVINGVPNWMLNWRGNNFVVEGRTVIVTGGSQGMGLEVGNVLSHKGANVVLVARNSAKLEKAIGYIKKAAKFPDKQRFHWISADVTSSEENERMINEVVEWNGGQAPDIVWACAGSSTPGFFLDTPVDTLKSQMDVNYFSQAYLAQTTLNLWLQSDKRGVASTSDKRPLPRHFIMTCSCSVFLGLPGYAPYSAPKSALRSLFDNLKAEINLYNGYFSNHVDKTVPEVKMHIIFPGSIDSPGFEEENRFKPAILKRLESADTVQQPLEVAQQSIKGLERGKSMVTTDFLGKLMHAGATAGSARDAPVTDLIIGGIASIVYVFVTSQFARDTFRWGRERGLAVNPT